MRRPAERAAAAALLAALAACTPTAAPRGPAPGDLVREVALPPAEAQKRFLTVAGQNGLAVRPDGAVAGPARPGSAVCPRVETRIMGGDTAQRRAAELREVRVRVTPSFVETPDGTRVSLAPVYIARMLDRLNYDDFEVYCRATGKLERALLDALAAGG
jgi:hypothetical protein